MTLTEVRLDDLPKIREGKIRAMFDVGEAILMVATDRISAYDVVLPDGIPHKGAVLNGLSAFWFEFLGVPHHMLETDVGRMPGAVRRHAEILRGRCMLVRRAEPFPVECGARGYLAGSGWREYRQSGTVCGIPLPPNLREADRLPEVIFTPATKATTGHDENISFEEVVRIVGPEVAERLRELTIRLYRRAADYALSRGIILADTKFEFGLAGGEIILIDEALTPDSSRFWPADTWKPGTSPPSFDKQFVRDWLDSVGWNRTPPAPRLPEDVIRRTSEKYLEAYRRLTGRPLV